MRISELPASPTERSSLIKLQIVIPTLDQSGAEKQFALLATGLPRNEFDVHVLALSRGGAYESLLREAGIPCTILRKRGRFDFRNLLDVRRALKDFQPDVILSCLFSANSAVRLATVGLPFRPVTLISERCVDSWKSGWQTRLDRILIPRTDRLIGNSQSVCEFYGGLGYPVDVMSVIPNGVEVPALPEMSRAEFLKRWDLPEDARLTAFVGRLAPQKDLPTLLWAMQLLRQGNPKAYLLLIGEGPERENLVQTAKQLEMIKHVRFLGHQSSAAQLLHHVDVFWLASRFEGMSNSLMEAMACGKPVIASDIPPNRELIQHGVDGYLVNPGDSAGFTQYSTRLLQDPAEAERIGTAAAMKMRNEYTTERMLQRYADLIRQEYSRKQAAQANAQA